MSMWIQFLEPQFSDGTMFLFQLTFSSLTEIISLHLYIPYRTIVLETEWLFLPCIPSAWHCIKMPKLTN